LVEKLHLTVAAVLLVLIDCSFIICMIGGISPVGHCWTGRLRSAPSIVVPGHRRYSHVLFHRQSRQLGKYPGEVDAGSPPLLPERSDHSRRQQERSAPGRDDQARADEDEAGAGEARGGQGRRGEDQCILIPRVLGEDQGRSPTGVRDGHARGTSGEEEEEDRVPATLVNATCSGVRRADSRRRTQSCRLLCTVVI